MTDPGPAAGRVPERAAATRAALLGAAREVFATSGFADASIAEVVAQAGASVGSLYHHFGGKADLYLALFEDFQTRQEERAASAVRRARSRDGGDPIALFLIGARAYLDGCWEDRRLARLFLDGGGPPGFELLSRRRYRDWVRRNATLLGGAAGEEDLHPTLVIVLTSAVAECGREVSIAESEHDAALLIEETLEILGRLAG